MSELDGTWIAIALDYSLLALENYYIVSELYIMLYIYIHCGLSMLIPRIVSGLVVPGSYPTFFSRNVADVFPSCERQACQFPGAHGHHQGRLTHLLGSFEPPWAKLEGLKWCFFLWPIHGKWWF
jgi:hypothetical protein